MNHASTPTGPCPFDAQRLDAGMEAAGVDVIVASAPHNVRYLLGGYVNHFYAVDDPVGLTRYQPLVGYVRGVPSEAVFIGSWLDRDQLEREPVWISDVRASSAGGWESARLLVEALRTRGLGDAVIGIEPPFLSVEVHRAVVDALPAARLVDGVRILEHLRAVKRPVELARLRLASELVADAMLAVFEHAAPGDRSREIVRALADEQRARGLDFSFCNIGVGTDLNRVPSDAVLPPGGTLSLDSGGTLHGYIGDIARMGIVGEPSAAQAQALAEIDTVQLAARSTIRAGATGDDVYAAATTALAECSRAPDLDFIAHGMGLVAHEAPRLADGPGNPHRYPADHRALPLEAGMVLSIETTLADPQLGYLKCEDTVAVTEAGHEGFGDGGRGWNPIGARARTPEAVR